MAYIDHLCRRCAHGWLTHRPDYCSANWCRKKCSLEHASFGPPELIPTFHGWHKPNHTVTKPGDSVFYPIVRTCDCSDCRDFYRELTCRQSA